MKTQKLKEEEEEEEMVEEAEWAEEAAAAAAAGERSAGNIRDARTQGLSTDLVVPGVPSGSTVQVAKSGYEGQQPREPVRQGSLI